MDHYFRFEFKTHAKLQFFLQANLFVIKTLYSQLNWKWKTHPVQPRVRNQKPVVHKKAKVLKLKANMRSGSEISKTSILQKFIFIWKSIGCLHFSGVCLEWMLFPFRFLFILIFLSFCFIFFYSWLVEKTFTSES